MKPGNNPTENTTDTDSTSVVSRRKMVAFTATTSTALLAGCTGLFGSNGSTDTDDTHNDTNDEDDSMTDDIQTEPPFEHQTEDLLLDMDDEWELNDQTIGYTHEEREEIPDTVTEGSDRIWFQEPIETDPHIIIHQVWICEDEQDGQDIMERNTEELEEHEYGYIEQTDPTEGLFEHVDEAVAYVLDDDSDRPDWELDNDYRHTSTATFRVGNIVTSVIDTRINLSESHESDDYEFYGAAENATTTGLDLLEQWKSDDEGLEVYLS